MAEAESEKNWLTESGKYIVTKILPNTVLKNLKVFEDKKNIFEVKEGESTLRKFTRQFTIDGKSGFDPQTFLDAVRNLILKILRDNRKQK